jgi:hypothetical protein
MLKVPYPKPGKIKWDILGMSTKEPETEQVKSKMQEMVTNKSVGVTDCAPEYYWFILNTKVIHLFQEI